jgi:nucleotide-binding universal stress UspA family protein
MLPPKKILSPVDFSNHSDDALNAAADLAKHFGSELHLLHVVPALPSLPSFNTVWHEQEYESQLHTEAKRRLDAIVEGLAGNGIRASAEVGTANDVGMEIVRAAEHDQVDLIVMSTHGIGGWRNLAFGSVAEKVLRMAHCAVLTTRVQPAQGSHTDKAGRAAVASS